MNRPQSQGRVCAAGRLAVLVAACAVAACGGGSVGNPNDSGANKTTLTVEAADVDGDALHYQWRVTAGSVENRDARETVWTMPDGPGLHFAYVVVSDGKGGYAEQQYAVATDALNTTAAPRTAIAYSALPMTEVAGSAGRLRFVSSFDATLFTPPAGGPAALRLVYLPDVRVQVLHAGGETVHTGASDLNGEVSLPQLDSGFYDLRCATGSGAALAPCGGFLVDSVSGVSQFTPTLGLQRNLRLHGHVGFADGGTCARQDELFNAQSSATVQLLQADGQALTPAMRVNRYGDYALDAAVAVRASLKLQVQCEAYRATLDVPASPDPVGYVGTRAIELSHAIPNSRPRIVKMVANGPEGSVRGQMVVPESADVASNALVGAQHFLTYKGQDTKLSACMYYRALGAVKGCDAQGRLIEPISFDDWKRAQQFEPYAGTNVEVAANYINKMDLNLVRRMVATQSGPQRIAFYVCNHPGPEGSSQAEVDQVMDAGLADEKRVACVAMEWSASPGVNGGRPFTKFLTFAPDGSLIASVNLDGRGEKHLPGSCVACHGGTRYNGRYPETGNPSPYLGAGFLPFDTGNYLFSSRAALTEPAQGRQFHALNRLALATDAPDTGAFAALMAGWYAPGSDTLDKTYVPPLWRAEEARAPGAARFYREVVGASCRTCHVSRGNAFDWDSNLLNPGRAGAHACGGTEQLALNASMPNALISRDRIAQRAQADPALAGLMRTYLGCAVPLPDPVYPRR